MSEAVPDEDVVSWREVRQALEEEIARLPDDLRSAVIVCPFEGRTQEEAGRALNVNPRTLKDRVRRGRELLQRRLTRRGVTLAALGAVLSGGEVEATVPAALQAAAIRGAAAIVNKTALAGTVSPSALALASSTRLSAGGVLITTIAVAAASIAGYAAWESAARGRCGASGNRSAAACSTASSSDGPAPRRSDSSGSNRKGCA